MERIEKNNIASLFEEEWLCHLYSATSTSQGLCYSQQTSWARTEIPWHKRKQASSTHSYSDEVKVKIGRYAAENGNSHTVAKYSKELGWSVPESKVCGYSDKVQLKHLHAHCHWLFMLLSLIIISLNVCISLKWLVLLNLNCTKDISCTMRSLVALGWRKGTHSCLHSCWITLLPTFQCILQKNGQSCFSYHSTYCDFSLSKRIS